MKEKYKHLKQNFMPKSIEMMFDYFQDMAEYNFIPELLESTLFFNTAIALQLKNTRIIRQTNRGAKNIIPNYMGIIFGNPGLGKDFSLELTSEPYETMFDTFIERAEAFIMNPNNRNNKNELEKRYIKISNIYQTVASSEQALQKTAQVISDMGFGSVNVTTGELGDEISSMSGIFTKIKQAYDNGVSEGASIISDGGDNYFTVKDIAYNSLLMGSPAKLVLKPSLKEDLLSHYISGVARRFFIFHNDNFKKTENRNPHFETMTDEDIQIIKKFFKELRSHINDTSEIIMPKETREYLVNWDIEKEILRENSESLISDDIGSPRKIERLSGIIATLDLSDTITIDHMKYAIDYSTRVDATAEESVKIKPTYEQIYDLLSKRGFISRTELIKEIRGLNMNRLDDEMILSTEFANELGNSIVKKEYSSIVKYKLEKLTETNLDKIIISVNENPNANVATNWEKKQGKFDGLHKILCSNKRYSAGTFLNGHITDKNYLSEQNLIIIDVDDGITIEDTKSLFSEIKYLITTTKRHGKEKNGKINDRFRLVLPTISKFHLKPEVYAETYLNILAALGMSLADTKCQNPSRWYYGAEGADYWYNKNKSATLLDIRPFIKDSSENHVGMTNVDKFLTSNTSTGGEHSEDTHRLEGAYRWFLARTTLGTRNDMIFSFGCMVNEQYKSINMESEVRKFNSIISEPLRESELATIINSIDRRT
ncbi:MAG: hypothetical protein L3I99_05520 [Sulfurimonas sp.]|nr:hypothetical protein [Sulfurimonas sp.]